MSCSGKKSVETCTCGLIKSGITDDLSRLAKALTHTLKKDTKANLAQVH